MSIKWNCISFLLWGLSVKRMFDILLGKTYFLFRLLILLNYKRLRVRWNKMNFLFRYAVNIFWRCDPYLLDLIYWHSALWHNMSGLSLSLINSFVLNVIIVKIPYLSVIRLKLNRRYFLFRFLCIKIWRFLFNMLFLNILLLL